MTTKTAISLQVGDTFRKEGRTFKVVEIGAVTEKTITFYTDRIAPDQYAGHFFNRWNVNKQVKTIN